MTLGRTSSGAIKIKTDSPGLRAVECGCCESECPAIENNYTVISETMYNALRAGGNFTVNGAISEIGSCSLNKSSSGILPPGSCNFQFGVSEKTCDDDANSIFQNAQINISLYVSKVGSEYRITYGGSGWCPYYIDYAGFQCYSFGWYIGWGYDTTPPGYFANLGSVTINTAAGTLGPYGIYSFPFAGSASLDVTLTPF